MSPHIKYYNYVTMIRTRGRELRTMQSDRLVYTCSQPLFSTVSLCGSCLSAGAYTRVHLPEPCPPLQSLHGCSCLPVLAPEPRGLPCTSSASLSPWSVSPAPKLPTRPCNGLARLSFPRSVMPVGALHPGPPATIAIANTTFLVAVESFSSARTSQERRTRCRVGGLGHRRQH